MSADVHVRYCKRPGVGLPRATHLQIEIDQRKVRDTSENPEAPRWTPKTGQSWTAENRPTIRSAAQSDRSAEVRKRAQALIASVH